MSGNRRELTYIPTYLHPVLRWYRRYEASQNRMADEPHGKEKKKKKKREDKKSPRYALLR